MPKELDTSQVQAVNQLRPGSILCGGVGSGKSRTALAYYYTKICGGGIEAIDGEFREPKNDVPLYIITTAMKRDIGEWADELSIFCLSQDPETSIHGIEVHIDSWNNIHKYTGVKDGFFILDEQRLVGSGAWVQNFYRIARSNQWILLSATPGDNWMDYIPIFVANGYYKNKTEFVVKHVVYKPYRNFPVVDHYLNVNRLERIREELLVNIGYQSKTSKFVKRVNCGFDKMDYFDVLKNRVNLETRKPLKNIYEFSFELKKTIYSSSSRVNEATKVILDHDKIIVFYNYDFELDILKGICRANGREFFERNGHKHDTVPDSDKWVYLVQYNSGAEGWNCTSTNAMLFYSISPSYKQMKQAAGRIDRRNTEYKNLYYYYLQSEADVENRIFRAVEGKKKFNDDALRDLWEI